MATLVREGSVVPTVALRRRMRAVLARLKGGEFATTLSAPAGTFFLPARWYGEPYVMPLIWFATGGCEWARTGGCSMCDFGRGSSGLATRSPEAVANELNRLSDAHPMIHLAAPGSFFDDREVPPEQRTRFFDLVLSKSSIQALGVESRPEFVTTKKLQESQAQIELRRPQHGLELAIGFGLECDNEIAREVCINKGTSKDDIAQALGRLKEVRLVSPGARMSGEVHVLLKAPLLSEQEAIDDAVAAICWAVEAGAEWVILMLCSVKPATLTSFLANDPRIPTHLRYRPPRLWSAVEVLLRLPDEARKRTLTYGFASSVTMSGIAENCPACTSVVAAALAAHSHTGDRVHLERAANVPCACRRSWRAECAVQRPPLASRIADDIDLLERLVGLPELNHQ